MKYRNTLLITGGLALGLVGGITIGLTEADDIHEAVNAPKGWIMQVANTEYAGKEIIPINDILSRVQVDGARVTEIELDREYGRDVYELEMVDTGGKGWDLDIDARTGEELSRHLDRD
ncbi:MAG TPA: PepSY domain-containing protein [Gammaproteobacteria bacterium]|nr:PepSY domain-containing protein [Gammaproteobacteria bacterium]